MATNERFNAPGVFDPPAYSQGVRVSGASTLLFLSGQVAYDEKGGVLHRGDFKGQAREALRCIKALVESQGGTMENVVKVTWLLTDVRYRADLLPVREEFFGGRSPASTLIGVSALAHPDWLIEVEAIAAL